MPKNTGMKNAMMRPRNCSSMCLRQDRRFADQDAGDEGAEHGMHADQVRGQRHRAHDHQDRGDDGEFADESVVRPSGSAKKTSRRPIGEANDHEGERADHALARRSARSTLPCSARLKMIAMMIQPMVSSTIAEARITWPTIAAHEVHLAHHRRDDLHRGDRQRGAEEQRRDQPLVGIAAAAIPAGTRRARSRRRTARRCRSSEMLEARLPPSHQPEIGLHAGQQQQQQDAELRDRVDHRLLLVGGRKERVLQVGQQRAEHRRTEHEAGHQHAPSRRAGRCASIASPSSRPTSISTTS